jgi:DNA-binding MarR family transcriptional regulator
MAMILDRLFSSKTRVKILTALLAEPEREYYMRELARSTEEVIGSVQRELGNLEELNLVVSQRRAHARLFRGNRRPYLSPELKSMIAKTAKAGGSFASKRSDNGP